MKKNIVAIFAILLSSVVFSQAYDQEKLSQITKRLQEESVERTERVRAYLEATGAEAVIEQDGVMMAIVDINEKGKPIYMQTDNVGAAITTGASTMQEGGELGLNLDGEGVGIAVWDGGAVRESHQEFGGRIRIGDGVEYNFHATHVAGTIIAAGVSGNAKGMAPGATSFSYDWFDDNLEMSERLSISPTELLISNHSYGPGTGWAGGAWQGDPDISSVEDYRFGFYSSDARQWDELVYNSPYYTIMKSAGNDRGNSGDGTFPPDGPYDIIGPLSTGKNIVTVGAVNKVSEYVDGSSVVMSSFSSWGPTDDGRIKPDFVAAGVNLFSTFEEADDDYGTISGTSMSTPNAAGTFALLQQLHSIMKSGTYMKAAQLKGLVAHTIREAGEADGPDYKFGWGLVNGKDAASFLLKENNINQLHREINLRNGESFELAFTPLANTKVTATICWTDLPGSVPAASLDPEDLTLVNDLDMRINTANAVEMPWILDPQKPGATATKGDNFRDNIEKIEFIADGTESTLTINHKGELQGSTGQVVHLFLSYQRSEDPELLYWTGNNSTNWNDALNWSATSQGESASAVPSATTAVIFDNATEFNAAIAIDSDAQFGSLIFLSDNPVTIDLGPNNLTINGDYSANDSLEFVGSGSVTFTGDGSIARRSISPARSLKNLTVNFNDESSTWALLGDAEFGTLSLQSGSIEASNNLLTIADLSTAGEGQKNISLNESDITITSNLLLKNITSFNDSGTSWNIPEGATASIDTDVQHQGYLTNLGSGSIAGTGFFNVLGNYGSVSLDNSFEFDSLALFGSSSLSLANEVNVTSRVLSIESTDSENFVTIESAGTATVTIDTYDKFCFDYLDVSNVTKGGSSVVSVGLNSMIANASGWRQQLCDDVIFAEFDIEYLCDGAVSYFVNNSTGNIDTYSWKVDGTEFSTEQSPFFEFPGEGVFDVELTIADSEGPVTYTKSYEIASSATSEEHSIFENSTSLVSSLSADSYQWFKDNVLVEGETGRTLLLNEQEGTFFVLAFLGDCNIKSSDYVIETVLSVDADDFVLYPNPIQKTLNLRNDFDSYAFYGIDGKQIYPNASNLSEPIIEFDFSSFESGVYILKIFKNNSSKTYKLILE